ncbi:hypothetical protein BDV06DRAFT_195692 [Aspergillus oleicola]
MFGETPRFQGAVSLVVFICLRIFFWASSREDREINLFHDPSALFDHGVCLKIGAYKRRDLLQRITGVILQNTNKHL